MIRNRPTVLVFLSTIDEVRRFALSGALDALGRDRRLHYVLPRDQAATLLAEAGAAIASAESSTVALPGRTAVGADTPPLQAIVDLFDRHAPLYCIVPSSADGAVCQEVIWACEVENVPCVLLQSEWEHFGGGRRIQRGSPFVGCWGRQSQDQARTVQGFKRRHIEALGAPQFEQIERHRAKMAAAGRRTILVIHPDAVQRAGVIDQLERAIAQQQLPDATVVGHEPPAADDAETWRRIGAADAVIAPVSSVLVAALILKKPSMALAFGGRGGMDAGLPGAAVLVWCDRQDQLTGDCVRLLEAHDPEKVKKGRRLLVNRLITREPGTYAERLAEFCRSSIDNEARKQRARRTGAKRESNSNSYGALLVARQYCGAADAPSITVPGHWMHGWLPAYHSRDPLLIAYHKLPGQDEGYDFAAQIEREREDTPQWVGRRDQADYLLAQGYRHVTAIGLPIAYVPRPDIPRVPGSLLVMPPHGHRNHGPDDVVAERYADAIAAIAPRFSCVYVGVSEDDVAKQQWVESFRRRGIAVFTTTDLGDPNTLARLRKTLSTFEYVTTNGFGSHIALAAYCGAKVSVYGPFAEFPMERIRSSHVVKMFPRFQETAWSLCTEEALRAHYPFLFVEPDRAVAREAWGAHEVGESCIVPPQELRRLFKWEAAMENRTPAYQTQ